MPSEIQDNCKLCGKNKLQLVLVRAYDTKIRIECKEIFFSRITFSTKHSDMQFF